MFGKKCTLCGGKLDGNNVCTECGLDNSKSEKNYKINTASCDREPLTHVHEENEKKKKKSAPKQYHMSAEQKAPKGKSGKKLALVVSIIFLVCGIAGPVFSLITTVMENSDFSTGSGTFSWDDDYDDYDYEEMDPYEYLEMELPESGDHAEYELTSGYYIVGVHIPAGNYKAVMQYDFDVVQVNDYDNGIYLYEYEGKDEKNYLNDLRLFDGAVVTISSETSVKLTTENAQQPAGTAMANPVTDTYMITDTKERTVGKDITPGVYDIRLTEGCGAFEMVIYDEDGAEYTYENFYFGEDESDGMEFKNLVLPENATITCEEGMNLTLTPSEIINSTDYLDYYIYY
ncbi:hypothetical protein JQM69_02480 [Faecalicatena contorta]|uniref:hypothetical protein n=1 Tax=Faecalicatena contorta TaxID=39482 RepID=UPI001F3AD153|nr:hypothetical protein [Faecalicatena contorta]MCF2679576.1 hypothetical protein [Faecalicatena contorta]